MAHDDVHTRKPNPLQKFDATTHRTIAIIAIVTVVLVFVARATLR